MKRYHALTVTDLRQETPDAVSIGLAVPSELQEQFHFNQGQHLNLRAKIDGEEVRRSYSICSGVDENELRIAVKRVQDGVFSNYANEHIQIGQRIEVMPPQGHFYTDLDPASEREYLAVAAGSGITPILSIIRSTLSQEPNSQFTLFYGNRSTTSTLFREQLEDLKNLYMERLNLIYIMSREQQEVDLFNGRITGTKCQQLLQQWIHPDQLHACFLCGPQSMIEEVSEALKDSGVERERIHFELFTTALSNPNADTDSLPTQQGSSSSQAVSEVSVAIDGRTLSFELAHDSENILDAGIKAGADLPWSCKAGVCSTCRAKVVEGEVKMDANFALEDYELEAGYVLTCQCHPVSDKVILDYDQ
ncbi:1,2-phenylacetyl-CoA epoxidase subunit PaaE [Motiliproteus sp. MSK22-1]|uniref:1,2-phenylacetyl-CoA epoxidase subunit PaaE n=1 Tax=Motiliproteus sp. MSK22-1 TaxID=1897630 RepID=UPI000975668F|nr:1,2-phenylacetyl-CoA epoxidase subunit PaaE [Motiliproteus sp. MSK22-1]OMH38334.1 phenylacetic acid degradation protein [Motiliproteus sp. MSK22-1]